LAALAEGRAVLRIEHDRTIEIGDRVFHFTGHPVDHAAPEIGRGIVRVQADGTVENWAIEAGTPNVLFRRGFTKESLLPGTEIVIEGYQAKDGSHRCNGRDLTLPDGRKLFLGSSGTGAPYELTPGGEKK